MQLQGFTGILNLTFAKLKKQKWETQPGSSKVYNKEYKEVKLKYKHDAQKTLVGLSIYT